MINRCAASMFVAFSVLFKGQFLAWEPSMLIEWDDSLSVGHALIDQDHKVLVAIINKLSDARDKDCGKEIVADILSDLSDYIGYHFEHEEQVMRRFNYKYAPEHVHEHAELIKGLDMLVYEFERSVETVDADTLEFLKHWLVEHIKGCDHKLALFLRKADTSTPLT